MRTLGVALVGAGVIGELHAQALQGLEEVNLLGVAEIREDVGRGFAKRHEIEWYPRIEDVLVHSDVDVVTLATPSSLHAEQAVMAAGAGKHVITEKPMAITLDDARGMIDAATRAGTTLSVIFQSRFSRDVLRVKRAVEAGLFGRIVLGNAVVHWRRTQEYYDAGGWRGTWKFDGGGALINQSIHSIDLLQWMLGPVASLAAYTGTLAHNIETEDTAAAALQFTSDAMGGIQGTTSMHRDWPPRVEIRGTEGSATIEGMRLTAWEPTRDVEVLSAEDMERTHELQDGDPGWIMHRTQMRDVFAAISEGRETQVSGEEACKALEIILAIYQSGRTCEMVTFPFS